MFTVSLHVHKIIWAPVFDQFFQSLEPQIRIFSQFKEYQKLIDTTQHSIIDAPDIEGKSELTVAECVWLNQNSLEPTLRKHSTTKELPRAHQTDNNHTG